MKPILAFEQFINESKKVNDFENSRNKILVGLKITVKTEVVNRASTFEIKVTTE